MKVGYIYHPVYLEHDTGAHHVERAGRLQRIMASLEQGGLASRLTAVAPRPAAVAELALVHGEGYIASVKGVAEGGGGLMDADTVVSPRSYEAAVYAAGGAIRAVEAVMGGEVGSCFALVRPPGHHAVRDHAMGFCLFNNIAIAAAYALAEYDIKRVAVVDFDVHHGNATQDAFYADPRMLYVSTHQYPFYPGSGALDQTGSGLGEGTTVNIPLPAACGDGEYMTAFREVVVAVVERFAPQLILVSAGYDAHRADHLGGMQVSTDGYARMTSIIKRLADDLCGGRLVLCLEGGYSLGALRDSVGVTFNALLGEGLVEREAPPAGDSPVIAPLLKAVKALHCLG